MARLRPWPVTFLIAWTLFTWGNRIPLLWTDDGETPGAKLLGTVPIVVFVALAAVAAVGVVGSGDVLEGWARKAAAALAAWSIAYWAVRLPFILANDHSVGFKAVHSVLAAVAASGGVWSLRTLGTASARASTVTSADAQVSGPAR